MTRALALTIGILLLSGSTYADVFETHALHLSSGDHWRTIELRDPAALREIGRSVDNGVFWDLRPHRAGSQVLDWTVVDPRTTQLGSTADRLGADLALCRSENDSTIFVGCRLLAADQATALGPRALWSNLADEAPTRVIAPGFVDPQRLSTGMRTAELLHDATGRTVGRIDGRVVAEGIALLPLGPREVVLLREIETRNGSSIRRDRFLTGQGETAALFEGPLPGPGSVFAPTHGEILVDALADDGIEIAYTELSTALVPGSTGFLQYSVDVNTALSAVHPTWAGVPDMVAIDSTGVAYQPDPGDPSTLTTLPEVWDFTSLTASNLTDRTFNTTRDDLAGNLCGASSCSARDLGPNPPDGTWQAYLKIDNYNAAGALFTRDIFDLNDNDTGSDPSIDVPYVAQDELNSSDRTQLCFEDSAGGGERFLRFFQFFGATPATATLGVGDTWTSGAWTSCNNASGLKLSAASICGQSLDPSYCAPACPEGILTPRARGRLGGGVGFRTTIVEDGWMHTASGNFIPGLLMLQETDLEAGANFLGTCNLGSTPNRAFDYFWIQEDYGLMALVSSPSNETMPADDWSAVGNVTDGADFTWGPFPPWQFGAEACLSGTKVSWELPADGSNLNAAPNVADYGYVVSWGSQTDPEALADWDTNLNRTPKPGEAGYLAAPPASEPTSHTITTWAGSAINATVTTALRYTDPDVSDVTSYRSAAFHKVVEDPARLDSVTFRVGKGVAPFVGKSGSDLALDWPAVAGAASYRLRVYDLDTKAEIACPAGLDCTPTSSSVLHVGRGLDASNYGYRVTAVDPCGEESAD